MIKKATVQDIPLIQDVASQSWRKHYPGILSTEQIEYMLELMYSENELKNILKIQITIIIYLVMKKKH
jgi:hypothetical protein